MIRLRWRTAEGYSQSVDGGPHSTGSAEYTYKEKGAVKHSSNIWRVLQYSVMDNPHELGIQDPVWSDWIDVPVE